MTQNSINKHNIYNFEMATQFAIKKHNSVSVIFPFIGHKVLQDTVG